LEQNNSKLWVDFHDILGVGELWIMEKVDFNMA